MAGPVYIRPSTLKGAVVTSFVPFLFPLPLEDVTFDLTADETYSTNVTVTQHPVEADITGIASISDHAVVQPKTVSINCVHTATPLTFVLNPLEDRLATVDAALQKMADDRIPVTITTGLRTLQDYMITSLSIVRNSSAQQLQIAMELQEVRTVQAVFVEIPAAPINALKRGFATPTVAGGTQAPVATTPAAAVGSAGPSASILKQGFAAF